MSFIISITYFSPLPSPQITLNLFWTVINAIIITNCSGNLCHGIKVIQARGNSLDCKVKYRQVGLDDGNSKLNLVTPRSLPGLCYLALKGGENQQGNVSHNHFSAYKISSIKKKINMLGRPLAPNLPPQYPRFACSHNRPSQSDLGCLFLERARICF